MRKKAEEFLKEQWKGIAVGAFIVFLAFMVTGGFSALLSQAKYGVMAGEIVESPYIGKSLEISSVEREGVGGTVQEEKLFVREGSVSIESENASGDAEVIGSKVKELNGFVENYNVYENDLEKRIFMGLRVPQENFEGLFYWILENFNIKSSDTRLYTIDVTLKRTEMDILEDALKDFEELRKRAKDGSLNAEMVDVIAEIVEKEVYFQEKLAYYAHSYAESKNKSEYATLNVEIVEKKPVPLFDRDFWREFWLGVKESIERIFEALKSIILDIPAYAFELLGFMLYWVLTLSAAVLVLLIVYKIFLFMKKKIVG